MTREEIMELGMEELETRRAAIAIELDEADADLIETLNAELDAIEERKGAINLEIEESRKAAEAVASGAGEPIEVKEERNIEPMENRNSKEYLDAWVEMQKGRATVEQRALLTELAGDSGSIAVPVYVEDRVNTAWESNEIVRRVKKSFFKGIVRVPVEVSADGAVIHQEGGDPISEEDLEIVFIELIPMTIKKMVKYSTEVLDLKGQAWVDYIFDEIEYQIVKKVADSIATLMSMSQDSYNAAGAALTTADIVGAEGLLSDEATNPVLITTRAAAAALKAAALSAQYGYDPFDGLEVLYADSTSLGSALGIVADLSGVQINLPDGEQPKFIVDEFTEAPADIVRVIGRLMVGFGLISRGKVVSILPAGS